MRKIVLPLLLLVTLCFSEQLINGYVTFYGEDPTLEQINAMTHMTLCFIQVDEATGGIVSPWGEERFRNLIADAKSVGTKPCISFGGGNYIVPTAVMESTEKRQTLVSHIMDFMETYELDGIDNDWEPDFNSSENDSVILANNRSMKATYNLFLKDMRDSLDTRFGEGVKTLSTAVTGRPEQKYWQNLNGHSESCYPDSFWIYCDFVGIMSYGTTLGKNYGDPAATFGTGGTVESWETVGLPTEKTVVALPFFGQVDWTETVKYSHIVPHLEPNDSSTSYVEYDFGLGNKVCGFSSVNRTLEKQRLAKERGMQGIAFWEMDGDVPLDHPLSLLRALSGYVPTVKTVSLTLEIPSVVTTAEFVDTIVLSNHFANSDGDMVYSLVSPLKNHSAVLKNDTLIITGNGVFESNNTEVILKAENSSNRFDFVEHTFHITVDSRVAVTAIDSDNLVQSGEWYIYRSQDQFTLPLSEGDLRTVTAESDTVVSLIGTIINQPTWNWTLLGTDHVDMVNMTENQLVIEYKSSIEMNAHNLSMSFTDINGDFHAAILKIDPNNWIIDTITTADLVPGYGQPQTIDYTQIDSIFFNMGGSHDELYTFQLKEYRIEPLSSSPISHSLMRNTANVIVALQGNGTLNLHHNFSSVHELRITDLRGREVLKTSLGTESTVSTISLPIARGVYIAQIIGAELTTSWKQPVR